ncbi:serine hydrolase domain-containing protein [Pararhodonellum marinum]|uniref:serine hydrolase domain-containing protein n=1 Tax=Pararhodonellum marinum TaxID=2755358 RepID=UPI00188DE0CD|nr:serine hydrolase [Pararhodonellum marinum]
MNRIGQIISGLFVLFILTQCTSKSYLGRWVIWNKSDIEDHKKFQNYPFKASSNPFYFHDNVDFAFDTLLVSEKKNKKRPLSEILENSQTTAFLIIRNDTILYEKYLNGYDKHSINTSFSTAKSITSLLVGLAIDDGFIASENDPITNYLPELLQIDSSYAQVSISHLLDMRSGIQFKDHDLPWGDKPKAYYHPRLRERVLNLPLTAPPGENFQYNSYNPIVIGLIIESATGLSPAKYFEQKIWSKIGMEYDGSWSMDSEESKTIKMESGLNLRAIDFAKLGRLVLYNGQWNGQQIVSEQWFRNCFTISPEHKVARFGDEIYYKNFWWLYSKGQQHPYIVSAWGHLGQYLYIFPDKQLMIVRMGKKTGNIDSWGKVFKEIAGYN